jgi:hypothetical protein
MNKPAFASFIGVAALCAILGCSTSQPVTPVAEVFNVPPPEVSIDLPLESPDQQPVPRLCKLGSSCLAMDPRPFEPCLLSTGKCRDKMPDPLLVVDPEWIVPPSTLTKTR